MVAGLATTLSGGCEFATHIDELVLDALDVLGGSIKTLRATCRAARAAATPRLGYVVLNRQSVGDVEKLRATMLRIAVADEFAARMLGGYPSVRHMRMDFYGARCVVEVMRSAPTSLVSLNFRHCVLMRQDAACFLERMRPLLGRLRHLALPSVDRGLNGAVDMPERGIALSLPPLGAVRSLSVPRGYEPCGGCLAELVDIEVASPMHATHVCAVLSSPKLVFASLRLERPCVMAGHVMAGTVRYLILADVTTRTLDALRGLVALEMVCVAGAGVVDCAGAFAHAHTVVVVTGDALRTGLRVVFDREATPKLRRAQVGAPHARVRRNPVFGTVLSDVVDTTRPYDAQLDALFAKRNARPELDVTLFVEPPLDGSHLTGVLLSLELSAPCEPWVCRGEMERSWLRQTVVYRGPKTGWDV
jgi:hypothetical protein